MSKLLVYSLWILLSLFSVSALMCLDCETRYKRQFCLRYKQVCQTNEGESCYVQNLYIGKNVKFRRYGCIMGCRPFYKPDRFIWYSIQCCNKNYCNE